MNINNVGYKFTHGNSFCVHRPGGSGDYVILFLRTAAVFVFDGVEVAADSGSFILYKKGTPQFFRADGDCFINDWLHFDLTADEEKKIEDMGIPFDTPVKLGDISFFSRIIKNMYQEKYSVNPSKEITLGLYFELITVKLAERLSSLSSQLVNQHYEKLSDLRAQIYNDPAAGWTVQSMARKTALSASYFQHLYKRTFGVGALADVISARIERAQYMLSSTHYSISRIASECGYKSDVHFMRQFKNETGATPTEYRKQSLVSHDELKLMQKKAPYFINVKA